MSAMATGLLSRTRFPAEGPLNCAVSGGADSLALLLLARRTGRHVTAWYVDHGLRPESKWEESLVHEITEALGAEFQSRSVHVVDGPNLEARAREARFAALPHDVLTGHTADDQAETVLLNLLRGSSTSGLSGMRTERHPLLSLRRSETRALCTELGLQPVIDPMNADGRFQRVRVRRDLIPLLADISKRDIVDVLARQAQFLRDDDNLLDELAALIDVTDAKALSAAPLALARRAVRQWLSNPLPPDSATVERVLAVARGETTACDVGAGRNVRRSHQRLGVVVRDVL